MTVSSRFLFYEVHGKLWISKIKLPSRGSKHSVEIILGLELIIVEDFE